VPTLRHDFPIRQFGITGLGETAMSKCKVEFVPQASGADDLFDLSA
jgi:hypothetical protein